MEWKDYEYDDVFDFWTINLVFHLKVKTKTTSTGINLLCITTKNKKKTKTFFCKFFEVVLKHNK